jgi:hypothetical protein
MSYTGSVRKAVFAITSIGVVSHETAHRLACAFLGIKVHDVCYLSLSGETAGHVIYGVPKEYWKRIAVSFSPFFFNVSLGALSVFLATQQYSNSLVRYLLYWFCISAITHSVPSDEDASGLWPYSKWGYLHPLFWMVLPWILTVYLLNKITTPSVQLVFATATTISMIGGLPAGI